MSNKIGRYSRFIRPITYLLDLITINLFAFLFLEINQFSTYFVLFNTIVWVIISINVSFYEVYRFTKIAAILNKLFKQFIFYTVACFAFYQFYNKDIVPKNIFVYTLSCLFVISFIKFTIFFSLKKYRSIFGGNKRNVILVGKGNMIDQLNKLFVTNADYGCNVVKYFNYDKIKKEEVDGVKQFILNEKVDIVFFSLSVLDKKQIEKFIDFSEDNQKKIKFLPDNETIISENHIIEYYNYIPILTFQITHLDDPIIKIIKRSFDVLFSLIVILLVLSWLIPILAFFIKRESNGPVFFKQGRPGLNEKEFMCYKFRSMNINKTTEKEASRNDPRVTKIGKFMRKTSIDELPQFFNVLLGEMSVVGPRPHLWSQNKVYGSKIKKYMARHYVKPGITGLAQVSGYRGEIETDEDMINRINYDVYYIKNWSLFLDLKIIFLTVYNIFKGEEKAY